MIQKSFNKLQTYIRKENHKGYDPYDTLNSWKPFHWFGKWGPILAIQIQKRNPVNVRPLIGIKKEINPKAFGLFLQAYSMLYQSTKKQEYLDQAQYFYTWLKDNHSKGHCGKGWGYNFPWASREKHLKKYVPSAVVTGFVAKGLYEYYQITESKEVFELLKEAGNFVLTELPVTSFDEGVCFSYTPVATDLCYNASLLAAETLALVHAIEPDKELKDIATEAVSWVVSRQKEDGRWNYSVNLKTSIEREQIDFHQGYVLESIFEIKRLLKSDKPEWEQAIGKGLEFYQKNQFYPDGRSLWRYPKKYPIEIHNQSQGIITFSKLSAYNKNYAAFANTIANWTINNMQGKDGHFYYQNHKHYKNKISYMRWSQAWMFLALTTLLTD
ncbi:MAG: hypothetical protein DRI83_04630 [Bacteroidetes bacterium]|nr:MAG: hypothetical protein DRI83_04630 [Bacteroidota bacterium]